MAPGSLHALAAWRSYATSGEVEPALLRPEIARAWRRARSFRVSPSMSAVQVLSRDRFSEILDANEALIRAAHPYLKALSKAAGGARHSVLLAAADGTVLDCVATDGYAAFERGSRMSEAAAGANGVGTALAEGVYVVVSGPEHSARGFHHHTCHGTPLRGPDGAVLGAICFTSENPSVAETLRKLVAVSARAIEVELRAARLLSTLPKLRGESGPAAQKLALLHQDIVQSQTAAWLQIELGVRRIGEGRADDLFAAAEQSLDSFLRSAHVWRLASGTDPHATLEARRFVVDTAHLLQVEAKTLGVELAASLHEDPGPWPRVDAHVARRVIAEAQRMLRIAVANRSGVVLGLLPAAGVSIEVRSPERALCSSRLVPFSPV